jgi:hypothetical protein
MIMSAEDAQLRAENKVVFFVHLAAYILVNAFFVILWFFSGGGFPWFLFIMFFWSIGLVAHAIGVYGSGRFLNSMAQRGTKG